MLCKEARSARMGGRFTSPKARAFTLSATAPRGRGQQAAVHCHEEQQGPRPQLWAATLLAASVLASTSVAPAAATDLAVPTSSTTTAEVPTVYFGNGCFWGRQKDFIDTEKALGRVNPQTMSAVVGYAGGRQTGPGGKVCYYYSDPRTVYERLGHAEVVQVALSEQPEARQQEFRKFADTYFQQFRPTRFGMSRLDPQDAGPGYRNVVGLPGGVDSPFFQLLQEANKNGMELRRGDGNVYDGGRAREGDELNVVWVVDSNQLPFYRAERYHQFHNGLGKGFGREYTQQLKDAMASVGKIDSTGCPELPF